MRYADIPLIFAYLKRMLILLLLYEVGKKLIALFFFKLGKTLLVVTLML
jgi:hypothetical protein